MKALFDTNILIDFLNRIPQAKEELARYDDRAISVVTWMEVLIGAEQSVEEATRKFLRNFHVIGLENEIAERAVSLRPARRIKLPDAIVWATAVVHSRLLVTRNNRDFPADDPGVRVPYRL